MIPAYRESFEGLKETINSICHSPKKIKYKILILNNYRENDSTEIRHTAAEVTKQLQLYTKEKPLPVLVFESVLTGKKAGVGMARKLLMDTALLCFVAQNKDGLIINIDADTVVEENYLSTIQKQFNCNSNIEAASIAFHHPSTKSLEPILLYELHLRYFINMKRLLSLPYAYQTVGSAMAVSAHAYAKEGGMNMRQAGEDFYFIHKFTKNHSLIDINDTCVYPSGRSSDRVPFGTGKAVNDITELGSQSYNTYNPESFKVIKEWLEKIELNLILQETTPALTANKNLKAFLEQQQFAKAYARIIDGSSDPKIRVKNFYNWFDAFLLMKCLHHLRDSEFSNVTIPEAMHFLLPMINLDPGASLYDTLLLLKEYDSRQDYNSQWSAGLNAKLSKTSASRFTHHSKRS